MEKCRGLHQGRSATKAVGGDRNISQECFKKFVCSRAYDIISEGRYRKFLVQCKSSNDEWAISAQRSVSAVQACVKSVLACIKNLEGKSGNSAMLCVCNEVISSLSPPCKIREGMGVCCITGARSECCIDLSPASYSFPPPTSSSAANLAHHSKKQAASSPAMMGGVEEHRRFVERFESYILQKPMPTHQSSAAGRKRGPSEGEEEQTSWRRSSSELLVHPKFCHFFLMLWYTCKIEHVVRNYTRCWLEGRAGSEGDVACHDIASICNDFSQQDQEFQSMCAMFNHGVAHVMESAQCFLDEATTSSSI